jgi:hypothetical protein
MEDTVPDLEWVQIDGRCWRVPCWLACEWDEDRSGGIRRLLADYGLTKYHAQREEAKALQNIADEARALRRFFSCKRHSNYRRNLTELERKALVFERQCMQQNPHLNGRARREWVAERMNRSERLHKSSAYRAFTPGIVYGLLENARDVLLELMRAEELRLYEREQRLWALNAIPSGERSSPWESAEQVRLGDSTIPQLSAETV